MKKCFVTIFLLISCLAMAQPQHIDNPTNATFKVTESFVLGKKSAQTCEDGIVVTPNFAAVIDGATAKSFAMFDGKATGRIACELLCNAVQSLPADATMAEAVVLLTKSINDFYVANNLLDTLRIHPNMRFTASGVIYSAARGEVWIVGDCQCMIGRANHTNYKEIDDILGRTRALVNEFAIMGGATIEQLSAKDVGREYIMPIMMQQGALQNNPNPNQRYGFTVFDGYPIDTKGVVVIPVTDPTVVLSSDGYPLLFDTLSASESHLKVVLESDPLCIRENIGTKGVAKGSLSYDDRAYIKLQIKK